MLSTPSYIDRKTVHSVEIEKLSISHKKLVSAMLLLPKEIPAHIRLRKKRIPNLVVDTHFTLVYFKNKNIFKVFYFCPQGQCGNFVEELQTLEDVSYYFEGYE